MLAFDARSLFGTATTAFIRFASVQVSLTRLFHVFLTHYTFDRQIEVTRFLTAQSEQYSTKFLPVEVDDRSWFT